MRGGALGANPHNITPPLPQANQRAFLIGVVVVLLGFDGPGPVSITFQASAQPAVEATASSVPGPLEDGMPLQPPTWFGGVVLQLDLLGRKPGYQTSRADWSTWWLHPAVVLLGHLGWNDIREGDVRQMAGTSRDSVVSHSPNHQDWFERYGVPWSAQYQIGILVSCDDPSCVGLLC